MRRRHAADPHRADTIAELQARLAEMQARLDALEGSVDAWQTVAGWLPSSGARLLAAWRQRDPQGTRAERLVRVLDIAGTHLTEDRRRSRRWIGRGLIAVAGTLRARAAA